MTYPTDFLQQIDEARNAPFSGWDFSWLKGKSIETSPAWNYRALARKRMARTQSMLDMDTGGGELLSKLGPFPADTRATEQYPPNIPIARERLEPLGIHVAVPPNNDHLPFDDDAFDLVLNRHGYYHPPELRRVMRKEGLLLTQQVGGKNMILLNELLQDEPRHPYSFWIPVYAVGQLEAVGFEILQVREDFPAVQYFTLGAVIYYLKAVPWQVEGFAPEKYLDKLLAIYRMIERDGKLTVNEHRFLIEARKI
jgi:SAM-dependent methyltransferase